MARQRLVCVFTILFILCLTFTVLAEGQRGILTIIGVPDDLATGSYDPQAGIFQADVSEFAEGRIQVELDGIQILGQKINWNTKDNHLVFQNKAQLHKDDFELKGDRVEYFADEKLLISTGQVVVTTEDATVWANRLEYDEKKDEALFTGNVKVVFADGTLQGEKFLLLVEKGELQFFGVFQGEF